MNARFRILLFGCVLYAVFYVFYRINFDTFVFMNADTTKTVHQGRNVKRIREMLGIKQESLASDLNMNQQKISLIEQKETIEPDILQEIADALKIPVEAIKNLSDEAANNFFNTFHDQSNFNYNCTFNPLERYIEAMEANKSLYERLLQSEKEKIEILQRLLDEKK